MVNKRHLYQKELLAAVLLWFSSSLFYMHQYMYRVLPTTLRHKFIKEFSLEMTDVAQLTVFLFYSYLFLILLSGVIIRRFGKSRTLITAVFCNQLAIIIMIKADQYWMLVISEVLFGLSGAFSANIALSYIKEMNLKQHTGYLTSITLCMGYFGVFLGGWPVKTLSDLFTWRIAIISFSLINVIIFCMQILGYRYSVKSSSAKWINRPTALFTRPTVSPYKSWLTWSQNLYACFQFLPASCFVLVWLGPFMHLELKEHKAYSIFSTSCVVLGIALGLLLLGHLLNLKLNKKGLQIISSLIGLIASTCIIYAELLHVWILFIVLFIMGLAMSAYMVATIIVQTHTPTIYISPILAIHIFFINIGGVLALNFIDFLLNLELNLYHLETLKAYHYTFIIIPISFLMAFIIALLMPKNL
ncbi:MFS transporter [Legionella israelensis]|uniref:MFS transporter n=1 Tax=Legionella israelensis TaxID=454 RepID=UPI001180349A|nr:MFS transporter [Legionella israelensis]QDP73491.1 MFS transporter [Legionella israelensis]